MLFLAQMFELHDAPQVVSMLQRLCHLRRWKAKEVFLVQTGSESLFDSHHLVDKEEKGVIQEKEQT
jgi:hypothetical protein